MLIMINGDNKMNMKRDCENYKDNFRCSFKEGCSFEYEKPLNARRETRKWFEGTKSPFRSEFIDPWGARFSKLSQKLFEIGEL